MSTDLQAEIKTLEDQVKYFEEAIASLSKPNWQEPFRAGNELARMLQERLQGLDNEAERQKSLEASKLLLAEVRSQLEGKKQKFQQVRRKAGHARDSLNEQMRQINDASRKLAIQLKEFEQVAAAVADEWQVLNYCAPTVQKGVIALPIIQSGNGCYIVEASEPNFQ